MRKYEDNLTTLYMVLFQYSSVIFCSTQDSLQQILAFMNLHIQTNLRENQMFY